MQLRYLLKGILNVEDDREVSGLTLHSGCVGTGDVFFALSGVRTHGLIYAKQAIQQGAVAILYDLPNDQQQVQELEKLCLLLQVKDLAEQMGAIAARFYGYPSQKMAVLGITGTNGKTSCSYYLAQALENTAVIGTLGWGALDDIEKTINTTPDALALQQMLASLLAKNTQRVVMEVSSHGLAQRRVNGIVFKGVIFTNISRDHLDYHGSMEAYIETKLSLLLKPGIEFVVVNLDDQYAQRIIAASNPSIKVWSYSGTGNTLVDHDGVCAKNVQLDASGLQFEAMYRGQMAAVKTSLFGRINLENVLAVMTAMIALGSSLTDVANSMLKLKPVIGRMQGFTAEGKARVFIDYAHTPDALHKVLQGLRQHCKNKLWLVFGCGGDRDRGKRAEMGRVAAQYADSVVLTNDNPRNEDPDQIIADILKGLGDQNMQVIMDRKLAIQTVVEQAVADDLVVVAGKGHEDYQEIQEQKIPYSDIRVIKQLLNQ